MVYPMGQRVLCEIQQVFCGRVNDVIVCYDQNSPVRTLYILLIVKEHSTARSMIRLLHESDPWDDGSYIGNFSFEGQLCFLLEYQEVRPIRSFFMGEARPLYECEEIVLNLILACIAAVNLPASFLYLILTQNQVQMGQDGAVYFTYQIDLEHLDEDMTEGRCAAVCARMITELLGERKQGARSLELIERKIEREAYSSFREIYRDIRMTSAPRNRISPRNRLIMWWRHWKDFLFRLLLIFSVCMMVIAVTALVSQLLFGDMIIFRILFHGFDKIGTETLN